MAEERSDWPNEEEECSIQAREMTRRFYKVQKNIRSKVTSELRKAKKLFFQIINPHNLKEFWRAVKYLTKNQYNIPYLIDQDGSESHSSQEQANSLYSYFTKCFNTRTVPLDEVHHNLPLSNDSFADLYCDELQIYELLYGLEVSKSSGPNGISARMLKYMYTFASIAPSVCKIFNLFIRMGRFPET